MASIDAVLLAALVKAFGEPSKNGWRLTVTDHQLHRVRMNWRLTSHYDFNRCATIYELIPDTDGLPPPDLCISHLTQEDGSPISA